MSASESGGWLDLVLLGIIQGITEFLPISSDGHLALAEHVLGVQQSGLTVTVALHAGTLGAVILYFRRDIEMLLRAVPRIALRTATPDERRLVMAILVGSIPTAILGLALRNATAALSTNLWAIGGFLMLSGAWNWVIVARSRTPGVGRGVEALTAGDAFAIGVVQGLAVLPGLSRSASTIGLGVGLGLSRDLAARFSFLLSLPAVAGALVLEARHIHSLPAEQLGPVMVGTAVSFLVGLASLWALFAFLRKGRFEVFAWYCWILGLIVMFAASRA